MDVTFTPKPKKENYRLIFSYNGENYSIELAPRSISLFAKKVGVTRASVYYWLDGTYQISPESALKIIKALNLAD